MSELFAGLPEFPLPAPAHPRDAAAVMLTREGPGGALELFWVRRGRHLAFSAGFYAFPGGRFDREDAEVPVAGASGTEERDPAALRVTAVRELFEETGVLLARCPTPPTADALAQLRRAMLDHAITFRAALERLGARIDAADLVPAGRWVTPSFAPIRFDARFFLAALPPGQRAEVWDGELVSGEWVSPARALGVWEAGRALLHPPILNAMQAFARAGRDGALGALRAPEGVADCVAERIEFQRGILTFPLKTPTLPPAHHTACYLVGTGELIVVDPGAPEPAEQARLARFVDGLRDRGATVKAVVLTHHHRDHVGGALAAARAFGAPLWAHARTADRIGDGVTRRLEDGEEIALDGERPLRLKVLHTPGHAAGHLCLFEPQSRALLCGDMVSGLSTIVIDPPEGDMAQYLDSLRRLASLGPGTLYPAHGDAIPDGAPKLEEYLRHRLWREERVLAALAAGAQSLAAVVASAYDDTVPALHPVAARSALASLLKLVREGRVVLEGDDCFRLCESPSPTR